MQVTPIFSIPKFILGLYLKCRHSKQIIFHAEQIIFHSSKYMSWAVIFYFRGVKSHKTITGIQLRASQNYIDTFKCIAIGIVQMS